MLYIVETHLDHVALCVKVDPRVGLGLLGIVVCIFLVLELQLVSLLVPHMLSLSLSLSPNLVTNFSFGCQTSPKLGD
jgi:hypothetical protein